MTGNEAHEGAISGSGRAGTIWLMLKSYETWGPKRVFGELRGALLPQIPPVATSLFKYDISNLLKSVLLFRSTTTGEDIKLGWSGTGGPPAGKPNL